MEPNIWFEANKNNLAEERLEETFMATFKPKLWKKLKKALGFKDKEEEHAKMRLSIWLRMRERYGVTDPNMWPNVPEDMHEMERCFLEMAAWQKGMTVEEYRKWLYENTPPDYFDYDK